MKLARTLAIAGAVLLVASGCGGSDAAPPSASTTATVAPASASPSAPSANPTATLTLSGDFGADLEKYTGIVPDDIADYEAFMEGKLCETDLNATVGPEFPFQVKRSGANDPANGHHPDMVRLVIAYNCPDRAEAAERYLKEI